MAARTALPQPPSTNHKVPKNSAKQRVVIGIANHSYLLLQEIIDTA
jgi:hypothetical protein